MLLLLSRVGVERGHVTWGAVVWLRPRRGPHLFFEGEPTDPVYMLSRTGYLRGTLDMLPRLTRQGGSQRRHTVFSHIASITLWFLWKARCSHILGDSPPFIKKTLSRIWLEIVYTLCSQWDSSAGSSRAAEERRHAFLCYWSSSGLFFKLS